MLPSQTFRRHTWFRKQNSRRKRSNRLGVFIIIGGTLSALAILIYGIFGESGLSAHSEWLKLAKELKRHGEPVYIAEMKPADVPPEQNFFAAEVFAGLAEDAPSAPLLKRAINPGKEFVVADLVAPVIQNRGGINLNWISEKMQQAGLLPTKPEFLFAGDGVRFGIHALGIDFASLIPATKRPASRFAVNYNQPFPKLPHLRYLEALGEWLAIYAIAQLSTGDAENAALDLLLIDRLANSISTEPFLPSQRTRRLLLKLFADCIRMGIDRNIWSDEQLAQFSSSLERSDVITDLGWAMRGERAQLNSAIRAALVGKLDDWNALKAWLGDDLTQLDIRSLRAQQSEANRTIQQFLNAIANDRSPSAFELLISKSTGPSLRNRFQEFTTDMQTSLQLETYLLYTELACALERNRLAYGVYPEKLDMLQPEWLSRVPSDPVTNKPFDYNREPDGSFRLTGVSEINERP